MCSATFTAGHGSRLGQAQHVAGEGAELDQPLRHGTGRLSQRGVVGEHARPVVLHHPGVGARGHDDRPGLRKQRQLRPCHAPGLIGETAAVGRLTTAALGFGKLHFDAGGANQRDGAMPAPGAITSTRQVAKKRPVAGGSGLAARSCCTSCSSSSAPAWPLWRPQRRRHPASTEFATGRRLPLLTYACSAYGGRKCRRP